MKILFTVAYYYPTVGGAEEVVRQVAQGLVKRGHQVTIATSYVPERLYKEINGVKVESFAIKGNMVKGISGEIEKFRNFLINSNFDIICNYAAQSWTTDLMFEVFDVVKAKKVLIPCGYSGLALWSKKILYWNYFRKLPFYLKKYDHIVYHSENYIDKTFGDKYGIKHYSIIPNAIHINEMQTSVVKFRGLYNIKTKYILLNVSNHFGLKGHSLLANAFKRLNRDDVTLVIIGNRVSGLAGCYDKCLKVASYNPRVVLLENTPREHVISAFHEADVFVLGSKVECFPLVILESMAAGVPFVSTNVGCVQELSGGIIIDSIDGMVTNINRLLDDITLREILSISGKNTCLSKYTWDKIILKYEELFERLVME
jgi:glycosyltransferase involved in cell wall biosynthesis